MKPEENLLPCPFCGMKQYIDNEDTCYPSGYGWKEDIGFREYVSFREVPKEQWCWQIVCSTNYGGCDAEMHGDSKQEVIDKWNRRI